MVGCVIRCNGVIGDGGLSVDVVGVDVDVDADVDVVDVVCTLICAVACVICDILKFRGDEMEFSRECSLIERDKDVRGCNGGADEMERRAIEAIRASSWRKHMILHCYHHITSIYLTISSYLTHFISFEFISSPSIVSPFKHRHVITYL